VRRKTPKNPGRRGSLAVVKATRLGEGHPEKKPTFKFYGYGFYGYNEDKLTSPGVSAPQGSAGCESGPGLRPSSYDGPTTGLPAGSVAELATAEILGDEPYVILERREYSRVLSIEHGM